MSIFLLSAREKDITSHVKEQWRPHINTLEVSEIHKGSFGCNMWELLNPKLRKQNIMSLRSNK